MPNSKPIQNLSNHTRLDPPYHFFILPVSAATLIATVVREFRHPSYWHLWSIVVALTLILAILLFRSYALKVQDRVIRLEENLRLAQLSSGDLKSRTPELSERQLIALRFASDEEAPVLAERALNEGLSAKQIKQAIRVWRPDYWRV